MDALHTIVLGQVEKGSKGRIQILLRFFCEHVSRCREPNRKFHFGFFFDTPSQLFLCQNQGDERDSFVGKLVRERKLNGISDLEGAWLTAVM